jgi:predicted adenine nucleotide alpha hydrolase (AANH) superfamily ATPase
MDKTKILLHICCAPCSSAIVKHLKSNSDIQISGYHMNPNIHPIEEWNQRRKSVEDLSKLYSLETIYSDAFSQDKWQQEFTLEDGSRCTYCYEVRLEETAKKAVELGMQGFTSSLLISPYQNHQQIRDSGEKIAESHGIVFFYEDFRSLYRESRELSRANGWYMQKYCGCIYSYQLSDHPKKPIYDF